MATIKDVARLAAVSMSTVSRVLNDSGYVGKEAYNRVMAAMTELNYRPNAVARGLVSHRTATLGLVIPDVANPFFSDIARGVEDEAIQNGFTVILCNTDWSISREEMYIQMLRGKWIDGVILVGSRATEEHLTSQLRDIPFTLVDRRSNSTASCVWSNNEDGALLATEHLIQIGCQNVVHIAGPDDSPSAIARREGFSKVITDHPGIKATVANADFRFEGGYRAAMELFQSDSRPDGIFAGNDMMAIAVIQAANECGMRIPEDIALVGYDDIAMSTCVYPALTTIVQPAYRMGRRASEMLIEQLNDPTASEQQEEFKPELKLRKSTQRSL